MNVPKHTQWIGNIEGHSNQGYGNNWNSWNYGGMVNPAPAQPQLKVASPTETEDTNDESET